MGLRAPSSGWEDSEEDGKAHTEGGAQRLELPHGIPSHDTFRRVLARLDLEALTQCFLAWTGALRELSGGALVSGDGKTWRHALDRATSKAAMHLVSAWAHANRLGLGQVKGAAKSKDITAIPKRLQRLDLAGATVTIEAMGCQKEMVQVLPARGAEYVLALQQQQGLLYANVPLLLNEAQAPACADIPHAYHDTVDGEQGRLEPRRSWITSDIAW